MTGQAGWYHDPTESGQLRYYDGTSWTEHVQPDPTSSQTDDHIVAPAGAAVPQPVPVAARPAAPRTPPTVPVVPGVAVSTPVQPSFEHAGSSPAHMFGPPHPPEQWGRSTIYRFDGGAGSFLAVIIAATLITVLSLGILLPFATVLVQRWRADHTMLLGHRLTFTGSATHLFGLWIKWWLLTVITLGIYSLWVTPRYVRWIVEHTDVTPIQPGSTSALPTGSAPPVAALPQHTGAESLGVLTQPDGAPAPSPVSSWYQ